VNRFDALTAAAALTAGALVVFAALFFEAYDDPVTRAAKREATTRGLTGCRLSSVRFTGRGAPCGPVCWREVRQYLYTCPSGSFTLEISQ
jgi:hypothetical protein